MNKTAAEARALVEAATAKVKPSDTRLAIVYPRVRSFDAIAESGGKNLMDGMQNLMSDLADSICIF